MNSEDHLDTLLNEAKASPAPLPSTGLIARVLADAATVARAQAPIEPTPQPGLWARILSPIGGFGGAFALASCAAFGVAVGAGYGDSLLDIPALDSVLATLTENPDSTSPFESLSYLMSES